MNEPETVSYSYFELHQARNWALDFFKHSSQNVHVHLEIKGMDPAWVWFLRELRSPDYVSLNEWNTKETSNYLLFFRDSKTITDTAPIINLYLQLFVDKNNVSVYAGLYDETGKRWVDNCLVIWNRSRPHVTNPGYAPGRCPDLGWKIHAIQEKQRSVCVDG
jgi:hypothetical protein